MIQPRREALYLPAYLSYFRLPPTRVPRNAIISNCQCIETENSPHELPLGTTGEELNPQSSTKLIGRAEDAEKWNSVYQSSANIYPPRFPDRPAQLARIIPFLKKDVGMFTGRCFPLLAASGP